MGGDGGDDLYDISVHEIINYNPDLSQCSGYTYDGTNGWTPNSSCNDNIPLAQADIAAAEDVKSIDKAYGYKTWDVTDMVRDWITNPATNFCLLLNSDTSASSDSNRFFASSEATDPDQRPKLVVTYTIDTDLTPPRDITNAHKIGFDGSNLEVGWTNPTSRDEYGELIPENQDFEGVMIRYNTGYDAPYPANHTEGTLFKDEYGNLDEFDSCEGTVISEEISITVNPVNQHAARTINTPDQTITPTANVNITIRTDKDSGVGSVCTLIGFLTAVFVIKGCLMRFISSQTSSNFLFEDKK